MSSTKAKKTAQRDGRPPVVPETAAPSMPQSAAAPSPFTPIADYAFLSDCHTGALVAPDGAIDWLCIPRFDSPSVFGSLLDRGAGAFRLGPFGINVPSGRHYEAGTNTLVTTWKTPSGWAEVHDALTMGPRRGEDKITPHTRPPTDEDADHVLIRTVKCIDGNVEVELVCEPGFDYGRALADWSLTSDRHQADATGAGQTMRLVTDMLLGVEANHVRARHVLHEGEELFVALSWDDDARVPTTVEEAKAQLIATRRFWRHWLSRARIPDHEFRALIQRSALAIKGLTYMPTGATVAALTTSLPETPGGERNWDYRYTWIRDSTFTLQALHFLDLDWEADEFMQFIADLERNDDGGLQIMYGIDGRRDLTEEILKDLSGYDGASPVRTGNGAFDQRQNDVFGAALDSVLLHTRRSQRLPRRLWPLIQAQAECAKSVWKQPDQGIWEARGKPQHYVSSKLCAGRDGPRREARGHTRREHAVCGLGRGRRGDQGRHPRARSRQARRPRPALRHGVARRLDAASGDLRFPPGERCKPARERARDRRRAHRARVRAPLPDRRDRRRPVRQGGDVRDLLVLARLCPGGHRRDAARSRSDDAPDQGRLATVAVRRGVRR